MQESLLLLKTPYFAAACTKARCRSVVTNLLDNSMTLNF